MPALRRPWPLRLRVTAAFAIVVAVVLAATGVVVHRQFARGIDSATDAQLSERATLLRTLGRNEDTPRELLAATGEPLVQLYGSDGRVLASARRVRGDRLLTVAEVRRAAAGDLVLTTDVDVAGTDDGARVRSVTLSRGAPAAVAAIAESRDRREDDLHRLAWLLWFALASALVLASYAGYKVAGAALAPVERIRARAAAITDAAAGARLPVPGTRDELDRLAHTLNELLDRLQGALRRERRLVSDASHELRTPLTVLRTRVEVALRGIQDPARLHETLRAALGDAERLSRLADDLLVLARADQGQLPLRPEPLDVQDQLEEAAERHRSEALPITVDVAISGGAVVLADADRVAQTLDNLIANAATHGAPPIDLRAAAAGGAVALSVRDHGPGFAPDYLPHAFERFTQPEGSRSGAGLGLAIVAAFAEAQGGRARAANHPDGGAVVTVELPAA